MNSAPPRQEAAPRRKKRGRFTAFAIILFLFGSGLASGVLFAGWRLGMPATVVGTALVTVPLAAFAGLFVSAALGGYILARRTMAKDKASEAPFSVGVPGPNPAIVKETAYECSHVGRVLAIRYFPLALAERAVGIAGEHGVQFMHANGLPGPFVPFPPDLKLDSLEFVGADAARFEGFVGVTHNHKEAVCLDTTGEVRWRHRGKFANPMRVTTADINGDGAAEFVVAEMFGIKVLANDGTRLWEERTSVSWATAVSPPGLGEGVAVVHTNETQGLEFRGVSGQLIHRGQPTFGIYTLRPCPWPTRESDTQILAITHNSGFVMVYDRFGNAVGMYHTPYCPELPYQLAAAPVLLYPHEPDSYAFLINSREGASLYLYNHARVPLYIECLDAPAAALAAIPEPGGEAETLLVGGEGKVWRYRYDPSGAGRSEGPDHDTNDST